MKIYQVTQDWYEAIAKVQGHAVAIGHGTTHERAISDCVRDIDSIRRLQAEMR